MLTGGNVLQGTLPWCPTCSSSATSTRPRCNSRPRLINYQPAEVNWCDRLVLADLYSEGGEAQLSFGPRCSSGFVKIIKILPIGRLAGTSQLRGAAVSLVQRDGVFLRETDSIERGVAPFIGHMARLRSAQAGCMERRGGSRVSSGEEEFSGSPFRQNPPT